MCLRRPNILPSAPKRSSNNRDIKLIYRNSHERKFKGRREDFRLVTEKGKYTSDWSLPNEANGVFLRAESCACRNPFPSISVKPRHIRACCSHHRAGHSGFCAPAANAAGPRAWRQKLIATDATFSPSRKLSFQDRASPSSVANSLAAAMDAAEKIVVDYNVLPA